MRRVVFALVCAVAPLVGYVQEEPLEHRIPPGYEPAEERDEQGLWMEFREYERKLNQSAMLVRDADINNYITEIVCRTAGPYCDDFRVYVVRNPNFNASMAATGMMQIWTGLIVRARSTDEIAAVVGHEIAHYTLLHSLQRLRDIKSKLAAGSIFDIGVAIATGISTPVGQATAALSVLSFNRTQETEADILGTRLLAAAGYDPHASYYVWQRLLEEEQAAEVKREEPGLFAKTHPASEDRAQYLKTLVTANYGPPDAESVTDDKLIAVLNNHYLFLMEDQIDTNRFGRTKELLERHREMGVEPGLVYYFYGEMFRQRADEGDSQRAIDAYLHSVETGSAPPEAFKNVGYLYVKTGDMQAARAHFRAYLQAAPEATDRAMIEFYLEE